MRFTMSIKRPRNRNRLPRLPGSAPSILPSAPWKTVIQLSACAMVHSTLPAATCSEFFERLAPGAAGSCADVAFFGFDGSAIDEFGFANGGQNAADIDLFDAPDLLPDFFVPAARTFSSVQLRALPDIELSDFMIEHRGAVGMLPLAAPPPAGMSSNRFIATGSQNRTVFTAHNPSPGTQIIPIEIALEQELELVDPINSNLETRIGASFLLKATERSTGILLADLRGNARFDSAEGLAPEFGEPFSPEPGYQGFTTSTPGEAGFVRVRFNRTLLLQIEEGAEIELETVVRRHVFSSGFDPGASPAATGAHSTAFNFAVTSPEPGIAFDLTPGVVNSSLIIPSLDVDQVDDDHVRLSWEAVDTQNYVILFTSDLSLPSNQWEERGTVSATAGSVQRDFPASGLSGFFALRTTFP